MGLTDQLVFNFFLPFLSACYYLPNGIHVSCYVSWISIVRRSIDWRRFHGRGHTRDIWTRVKTAGYDYGASPRYVFYCRCSNLLFIADFRDNLGHHYCREEPHTAVFHEGDLNPDYPGQRQSRPHLIRYYSILSHFCGGLSILDHLAPSLFQAVPLRSSKSDVKSNMALRRRTSGMV